jgi:hypothetical protein
MVNLSRISDQTVLGKVLRAPLRLIPRTTVLPILQGPPRGKKWIVSSSNPGCLLGSDMYEEQCDFRRAINPGDPVMTLLTQDPRAHCQLACFIHRIVHDVAPRLRVSEAAFQSAKESRS